MLSPYWHDHPPPDSFLPLPPLVSLQQYQEPDNASQLSKQRGSIAKLVAWAAPSSGNKVSDGAIRLASAEDNAKTASCLGVIRR